MVIENKENKNNNFDFWWNVANSVVAGLALLIVGLALARMWGLSLWGAAASAAAKATTPGASGS